jgi:dipeptidyl aminopeptidase/acylaminoacyl peptidase
MIPLIPRQVFFSNPDRTAVTISPDGKHLAFLAPLDGVKNVWVAPRQHPEQAHPVTHDSGRGIPTYYWPYDNTHLLYIQDKNGDENWHIFRAGFHDHETVDLTPFDGVQARIEGANHLHPSEVIIGLNRRTPEYHDLFRLNIETGALELLQQNDGGFNGFLCDDSFTVRLALHMTPDGGFDILKPVGSGWEAWDSIGPADLMTTQPVGFDTTGKTLWMVDSRDRNTAALYAVDLATHRKTLLAEDPLTDAQGAIIHPTQHTIQAVAFIHARKRWQVVDPTIQPDLDFLANACPGEFEVTARSLDDRYWTVAYTVDDGPTRFYIYDRSARSESFLFTDRKALEKLPLAHMYPAMVHTVDGFDMVVYVTLPPGSDADNDGIPDHPLPMVFSPHGGPWGRDFWGYNGWHQWLANRGYAVLSANFRASTGFGKAFTNAGDNEWGGKIIEDQVTAVQWAVDKGIAEPHKIAIAGGSFGGYSTLAGLTFYPEVFACGVDLFGPSNLVTLLKSAPPHWKPQLDMLTTRVGDYRTDEGRTLLTRHSPLTYVDRIIRPLLIGQGANDIRVTQAESDQITQAMQAKGIPVTYVLYPDEGHGFARPENNLSFNAITEAFLAKVLGGRCEPVGDDFKGSSLQVIAGADQVPGLPEAMQNYLSNNTRI